MPTDADSQKPVPAPDENASLMAEFTIRYRFPVVFTEHAFDVNNNVLRDTIAQHNQTGQPASVMVFVDDGVVRAQPDIIDAITAFFSSWQDTARLIGPPRVTPGGEAVKTAKHIDRFHRDMLDNKLDRHNIVVAIGGGAMLDAIGFACSSFHRGIPLIRMPSTVLAQNDAGIGVKNGYNAYNNKNLIGHFMPPLAVINDARLLDTLAERDKRAGLAEAVKVALIRDGQFFDWLEHNANQLACFEDDATQYAIQQCARLHLAQITNGGDPFETGNARPLDYGHWAAHKLELLLDYHIRHGEAVAVGMAIDACYASLIGMINKQTADRVIHLLNTLGFTLCDDRVKTLLQQHPDKLLAGLEEFRQHLGGTLSITLLTGIGDAIEVNEIHTDKMQQAFSLLAASSR